MFSLLFVSNSKIAHEKQLSPVLLVIGSEQMTMTLPLRLMILHFSHIFLDRRSDFHYYAILSLCLGLSCSLGIMRVFTYFDLQVMRPLLRSYMETSTVTLSPGRIQI